MSTLDPADIVLVAHGSPDPRHRRSVSALAERVRARAAGRTVYSAYLDHHPPSPPEVACRIVQRAVVVPVLLTPAYHVRVDIPEAAAQLRAAGGDVVVADALGPDPALLDAVEEELTRRGHAAQREVAVIVFAAGSSDSAAVATVSATIAAAPRAGWGPWQVAALDGGDAVEDVVAAVRATGRRPLVVAFMVAEGILQDRMRARTEAVGADFVAAQLGDTDAVAGLVLARTAAAEKGLGIGRGLVGSPERSLR